MQVEIGSIIQFIRSKNIAIVIEVNDTILKCKYLKVDAINKAVNTQDGIFLNYAVHTNFTVIGRINRLTKLEKLVYEVNL
jgi:hypothetical protein